MSPTTNTSRPSVSPTTRSHLTKPWRELWYWTEIDSTQAALLRLASENGRIAGLVAHAECQTAGRGRLQRKWDSQGGGLYVSAALPWVAPWAPGWLPLLGALACVEVLEREFDLSPRIKWPNDVLIEGRKIAGLLGETVTPAGAPGPVVILGLGLNWLNDPSDVVRENAPPAVTLADILPGLTLDRREAFLIQWLDQLAGWGEHLLGQGQEGFEQRVSGMIAICEERLYRMGEPVRIQDSEYGELNGVLVGLNRNAAARVQTSDPRMLEVYNGSLKVEPADRRYGLDERNEIAKFRLKES